MNGKRFGPGRGRELYSLIADTQGRAVRRKTPPAKAWSKAMVNENSGYGNRDTFLGD